MKKSQSSKIQSEKKENTKVKGKENPKKEQKGNKIDKKEKKEQIPEEDSRSRLRDVISIVLRRQKNG